MTTDPTTAPATVDSADLRATIRDVINRFGFRVLLDSREHELSEVPDAFADHLTDALTAAGWTPAKPGDTPGTVEPDDDQPAPVDLGDEELRDSVAIALAAAEDEPVVSGHYALADAALAAVAAAGWPDHPRPTSDSDQSWEMAVADVDQLTADVERLTAELHAQEGRLIGQLHVMEQRTMKAEAEVKRLTRERDAERERADQLARELKAAQGERVVSAVFGHHKGAPRPFSLYRRHDVSGVSGTGVVALGAQWPDGTTVIRWLGDRPSTVVWESMEHAEAVHGHAGATRFVWLSDEFEALAVQEERETRLRDGIERIAARCEHNARDGWTGMASTAKALRALLDGPTPAPNTTQPLYVDHEGKPTGEPRVEVTANVHIVPAGPASSPTSDQTTSGEGQDTTETKEAAALHAHFAHPGFEYAFARAACLDPDENPDTDSPEANGWEVNTAAGRGWLRRIPHLATPTTDATETGADR